MYKISEVPSFRVSRKIYCSDKLETASVTREQNMYDKQIIEQGHILQCISNNTSGSFSSFFFSEQKTPHFSFLSWTFYTKLLLFDLLGTSC